VRQLASGVAAFRAIAWSEMDGEWRTGLPRRRALAASAFCRLVDPIVAEALSLSGHERETGLLFMGLCFRKNDCSSWEEIPGRRGVQRAIAASSPL